MLLRIALSLRIASAPSSPQRAPVMSSRSATMWRQARPGRDSTTLEKFFDSLGAQRCAEITLVSADAAEWIATVVAARCQHAELCLDPFHIVAVGDQGARRGPA